MYQIFKAIKYPLITLILTSGFGGDKVKYSGYYIGKSGVDLVDKRALTTGNNGVETFTPAHYKAQTKPYRITNTQMKRRLFIPQKHYEYSEVGEASYYGGADKIFHGKKTATGEIFSKNKLSAAHRTLPIPCVVKVTNLENGKSLVLKVTDRGPYVKPHKRIIDVSEKAAKLLGFHKKGTTKVRVETLVDESLDLFKKKKQRRSRIV